MVYKVYYRFKEDGKNGPEYVRKATGANQAEATKKTREYFINPIVILEAVKQD